MAGGAPVNLSGSGADPEGQPITYAWTQSAGPAVSLTGANTATPSFTAPATTSTLKFDLKTNDGVQDSAPSTVTVTVTAANQAPIARAGNDRWFTGGEAAALNGSYSFDPDSGPSPLTYSWAQIGGPAVTLSSTTDAQPTFTTPSGPADLTFRLTVSDGAASPTDDVVIHVGGASAGSFVANDYNGDGKADAAFYNTTTGVWSIFGVANIYYGNSGDLPAPGDYTGDGVTDLSTFTPADAPAPARQKSWWTFGNPTVVWSNAQPGDIPVPGDYDGDGKTDQALYRPSSGRWFFSPADAVGVSFGAEGAIPVPADYDGNGSTDLAYYVPTTGDWHIGSGTTPGVTVQNLGGPGYTPVPGNYVGSAAAELMVVRQSDGKWFRLGVVASVGNGAVGDIPAAADYDAVGHLEIGRARHSSHTWLINTNPASPAATKTLFFDYGAPWKVVTTPWAIVSTL